MDKTNKSCSFTSTTLANGLLVLEFTSLAGQKKGVTLQEITKSLDMHRSKVYRYLKTLVNCGWLEYDIETSRYRIGGKPLQIAGASLYQLDLRTIARPFLQDLVEETCLAVHLGVLSGCSIIYIDKVENNSPIQMRSRPGMMAPAHSTAMGRALLANYDYKTVTELMADNMPQCTPNTITRIEELLADLAKVQERGYAIDQEENEIGIGCIAAAIFGYDDEAVGAVSLSTMIQNLTPENIDKFSTQVMNTANRISQSMGCHHNHWSVKLERTYR
jgi:IclR family KDG regulon transcriptional repressor